MNLANLRTQFESEFNLWLTDYLAEAKLNKNYSPYLLESESYSLLGSGKRFRPFLSFMCFRIFSEETKKIKNICLALEMIHTYSLIHDDLPCMDNDDFRRGKPTNHKVYSEDIALLAGDGLLTDAFLLLSTENVLGADISVKIINQVARMIGSGGMVSGQAFDMKVGKDLSFEEIQKIHKLKTANLIEVSVGAAAAAGGATPEAQQTFSQFGYNLGMAFQIKDDLLDYTDKGQDHKNYVSVIGKEKTLAELKKHSDVAKSLLAELKDFNTDCLFELVEFNLSRDV